MSFQYVHTSAKRGLEPGKSGFCCVARDADIPPDLIQALEKQSRYHHFSKGVSPNIMRHSILTLRSGVYHVLSRIQDSGTDYSRRNNHIAHHIAFTEEETLALPNPASILVHWSKWLPAWDDPPRILEEKDKFQLRDVDTRRRIQTSHLEFPKAVDGLTPVSRVFEITAGEEGWLASHFSDALNRLSTKDRWKFAFTNLLLPTDQPGDFVWSGVWQGSSLPFELDYSPKPVEFAPKKPTLKNTESSREKTSKSARSDSKSSNPKDEYRRAPVVEIPDEFDRSKYRRPKRKFGRKEINRAINGILVAGAGLCITMVFYWYWSRQDDVDYLIKSAQSYPNSEDSSPTAESIWAEFKQARYPASQLAQAQAAAIELAQSGDDEPLELVAFLDTILGTRPIDWRNPLSVPGAVVITNGSLAYLDLEREAYPRLQTLALAPRSLVDAFAELGKPPLVLARSLQAFEEARFSRETQKAAVDIFHSEARRALMPPVGSSSHSHLRAFKEAKDTLASSEQYAAFLDIHEAFGLPQTKAYLYWEPNGRLNANGARRYSAYLVNLLSDYVLSRYRTFENSPGFRPAFNRISSQTFLSAHETAKAIYELILMARPQSHAEASNWTRIQESWEKAFMREDLMEETIVSYTLESLESTKANLLDLQSRITTAELDRWQRFNSMVARIQELASPPRSSLINQDWIVFDIQSPN